MSRRWACISDARPPMDVQSLLQTLVVFDAAVMPELTPLPDLAERCGCTPDRGCEMRLAQIPQSVDRFLDPETITVARPVLRV